MTVAFTVRLSSQRQNLMLVDQNLSKQTTGRDNRKSFFNLTISAYLFEVTDIKVHFLCVMETQNPRNPQGKFGKSVYAVCK